MYDTGQDDRGKRRNVRDENNGAPSIKGRIILFFFFFFLLLFLLLFLRVCVFTEALLFLPSIILGFSFIIIIIINLVRKRDCPLRTQGQLHSSFYTCMCIVNMREKIGDKSTT